MCQDCWVWGGRERESEIESRKVISYLCSSSVASDGMETHDAVTSDLGDGASIESWSSLHGDGRNLEGAFPHILHSRARWHLLLPSPYHIFFLLALASPVFGLCPAKPFANLVYFTGEEFDGTFDLGVQKVDFAERALS